MAISEPFVGAPTISTAEFSYPSNSTTRVAQTSTGVFQMYADVSTNVLASHTIRFRVYEKINAGTQHPIFERTIVGVQSRDLVFPSVILKDGWDFTAIVLAGADVVIPFSIRRVI